MFDPAYVLIGFVVGMLITSVFTPPVNKKRLFPMIDNPDMVFQNPNIENGCFRAKAYQVSCTAETEVLNKV
jgi:hypothetical protein